VKLYFLFLFLITVSCAQLPSKRTDKLSIIQGVTNSKEVEFSIVAPKNTELRFELRSADGEILSPAETKIVSRDFSKYVIHKIIFARDQKQDYNLYAFEGEKIIDQRLIGRGQKESSQLRLAVASCSNDFYTKNFKIWETLIHKNPEYLLMIGDNVYTDVSGLTTSQETDPEIIWNRYMDVRLSLPVFFSQKLIPIHALWDDHDYGKNNGNESYQYKEASKEIFDSFFAQELSDDDYSKGFGVGGLLSLGDFNLYFLDGRSFRSTSPQGSHLGLDQTAWFYSKLREEGNPSFIIKGDQFFGGYHRHESFEGNHSDDFQKFVTELRQINTPFVFLSGDRHMSEIMQFPRSLFGKPSFEVTSSPIHARMYDQTDVSPWRVVAETSRVNFTLIDSLAKENHWFMDIENIGENGDVHYRREVAVYIKDLQNNLEEIRKRRSGKRRYKKIRRSRRRR
jgi:alkaline phosphatase D